MKKKLIILGFVGMLLAASILDGCGKKEDAAESSETTKVLGDFSAMTYTGQTVDQSILAEADVTMINVWTTYCGYCIDEMPILQKLSEEYREQGLQIIGIVSDVKEANDPTVTDIVDALGLTYTNLVSSDDLQKQMLQFIQSVPTTVFLDSEGNAIGKLHVGARDEKGWREIIENTLELAGLE